MPFDASSLLSGLVGAAVGAAITHFREGRKARSDLTFQLHEEFSNEYMLKCRTQAYKILKECRGRDLSDVHNEMPLGALDPVWAIMGFYEKLSVALLFGRLDKDIVPALFGEIFLYWYITFFKSALKDQSWTVKRRMEEFDLWLQMSVSASDYTKWIDNTTRWPD